MSTGLDTSVVIRLLTADPPDQFAKAAKWMAHCVAHGDRPMVTDLVVVEAYFALQSHYAVPKAEALRALQQLLESGDVEPVGSSLKIMQSTPNLASAKPGFVDRLIHAELHGHGARLVTFEKEANRLPGTKVL